ncbi:hypothetical protein ACIBI8_37495 [Streptomyces sp. NPDC050529]|uniref:hypothetical protein n=1 Tax=Streptomyces sp. NPDC050529 TaxID=3365624 RepID=UPI00379236C7
MDTAIKQHQMTGPEDYQRCTTCGMVARHQTKRRDQYGMTEWMEWRAADGRDWLTTGDQPAPPCPPPPVEALCPWRDDAMFYAGPKGDVQLATAMKTWCDTHKMAVSDCPQPGPYCPGADAHADGEEGQPGPCTGRENSCKCMCPACCGDTPDVWGYDGDR